ncbi:MAG: pyridoxal-phosphate dependent enzyme [Candidatus Heimdallarchaeaceae archaeon]
MWINKPTCSNCGFTTNHPILICPKCDNLLVISPIKGPSLSEINLNSLWSFQDFLPKLANPVSLYEGNTPILTLTKLPQLKYAKVKLELRNPTGSFRDRASSVIVSDATQKKFQTIVGASTGSFSISLSAYSAKAGLAAINVLPLNLELSKIEQMKIYGAKVIETGDSVDTAISESEKVAKLEKAYLATPERNILAIEGQKTLGLELIYQNSNIESVVIPRGSGSLIYSVYRGFQDAVESNWIEKIPKIYSVSLEKTRISYLAESLEINRPFLIEEVKKIVKRTDGEEVELNADIMIDAAFELAKNEGIFVEPASASVIAATRTLLEQNKIKLKDSLAILTGSGVNALNIFASRLRGTKKVVWGLSESSTTKFEILNLIAKKKSNYGYSIWKSLGKTQSYQSIYQHLSELKQKGIILEKEQKNKRKVYELTKKGFETLEKMINLIDYL